MINYYGYLRLFENLLVLIVRGFILEKIINFSNIVIVLGFFVDDISGFLDIVCYNLY